MFLGRLKRPDGAVRLVEIDVEWDDVSDDPRLDPSPEPPPAPRVAYSRMPPPPADFGGDAGSLIASSISAANASGPGGPGGLIKGKPPIDRYARFTATVIHPATILHDVPAPDFDRPNVPMGDLSPLFNDELEKMNTAFLLLPYSAGIPAAQNDMINTAVLDPADPSHFTIRENFSTGPAARSRGTCGTTTPWRCRNTGRRDAPLFIRKKGISKISGCPLYRRRGDSGLLVRDQGKSLRVLDALQIQIDIQVRPVEVVAVQEFHIE